MNNLYLRHRFIITALTLSVIIGFAAYFCARYNHPGAFVLLLIIIIVGLVSRIPRKKFAGYVCESCGAEYNSCSHATLEDYTLVKKP
jgi:hypothetical protein